MRRGDVAPRLIERVAYSDALPWPALAGGEAHRVAVAAHQHGDGEVAALGGADDADELRVGGGEDHGWALTYQSNTPEYSQNDTAPSLKSLSASFNCSLRASSAARSSSSNGVPISARTR